MKPNSNLARAIAEILLTRRIIVVEPSDPVPTPMDLDRYIAAKNPPAIVRATARLAIDFWALSRDRKVRGASEDETALRRALDTAAKLVRNVANACIRKLVRLDGETLETVDEYDTLVNPERDVGPVHIHGISASMVEAAPTFAEIAGELADRLDGSVLVAHNLPFDTRMVRSELDRLDATFIEGAGICTLRLSGSRLSKATAEHGIPLDDHHRALADAECAVVVDFTVAAAARTTLPWLALHGMHAVVGTTGFTDDDIAKFPPAVMAWIVDFARNVDASARDGGPTISAIFAPKKGKK